MSIRKTTAERIEVARIEKAQVDARIKKLLQEQKEADRKARTKRLIERVLDFDVEVESPNISAALEALPDKKRDIVLLSYFLDMSDTEIAQRLNLANSTIHFHKTSSLKMLKKLLEEGKADE